MVEDKELIRQFAAMRSEAAFAELVNRHLRMVYGAALRQVNGDFQLAEDVAQLVFADLARKAPRLQGYDSIAGWLYSSARFTAANVVRAETRRRAREQSAMDMTELNTGPGVNWDELHPIIDGVLCKLAEKEREAIVLRYFEALEFPQVGAALGVSESGARMRVERALEKIRGLLQQRGLSTSSGALADALSASTGVVVPAHLAVGITNAAAAHAVAGSATTSILKIIAMKKATFVTVAVLAAALVTGVTVKIAHHNSNRLLPLGVKDGVRSVEAKIQMVVGPGETIATGGWLLHQGKRCLVFITPQWTDAAGNPIQVPLAKRAQLVIEGMFVEASESDWKKLGMANLFATSNSTELAQKLSATQFESLVTALKSQTSADILSAPRISMLAGRQASINSTEATVIAGKTQNLGPELSIHPEIAADGTSINIVAVASDSIPE
jgi:RNA polymerase sigma factor (sigma-70 family)